MAALTAVPARALGLGDRFGLLEPGYAADIVVLDDTHHVTSVWAAGARLPEAEPMYQVPNQAGRRIIVTGANSGLGKEAAKRLAAAGAEVVMAVRTPSKGEAARAEIEAEVPGARLEVRRIDLADLASVREFAARHRRRRRARCTCWSTTRA